MNSTPSFSLKPSHIITIATIYAINSKTHTHTFQLTYSLTVSFYKNYEFTFNHNNCWHHIISSQYTNISKHRPISLIFISLYPKPNPQLLISNQNYKLPLLEDEEKWEEELRRDLQEFELVSGDDVDALDEEALAREIAELEKSTSKTSTKKDNDQKW